MAVTRTALKRQLQHHVRTLKMKYEKKNLETPEWVNQISSIVNGKPVEFDEGNTLDTLIYRIIIVCPSLAPRIAAELVIDSLKTPEFLKEEIEEAISDVSSRFHLQQLELYKTTRPHEYTELASVDAMAGFAKDQIRYVAEWREWLFWDGKRWAKDKALVAAASAYRHLIESWNLLLEEDDPLESWRTKFASGDHQRSVLRLLSQHPLMVIDSSQLDSHIWEINCQNGILDLKTKTLIPHAPDRLHTQITKVSYNSNAICPKFSQFLEQITVNRFELCEYFQRLFGYGLTGSVQEQQLFYFHGDGRNGKGVLSRCLEKAMGDYAVVVDPSILLKSRFQQHPTIKSDLFRARIAFISEPDEGSWDVATIKNLTGGDTISARRMGKDFFSFIPTHKFVISANPELAVPEGDVAFWARMRKIPFDASFAQTPDVELEHKLSTELEGIFNWAVEGCQLYLKEKPLKAPDAVNEASTKYREEQETVPGFLRSCVLFTDGEVARSDLRQAYEQYCKQQGIEHALGIKRFTKEIKRLIKAHGGGEKESNSLGRCWTGMLLRDHTGAAIRDAFKRPN